MQIQIIITVIVAIGAAAAWYFLIYKKRKSTVAPVPSPSSGWTFQYSIGMPVQMTQASDGSYFFDFPAQDGVHYVVEAAPSLQLGQLITLSFNLSASGYVVPVEGESPAKVSLYMQRKGDNLTGAGQYQQYRYFHSATPLINGDGSLAATLTPDQWTDVFGEAGTLHQTEFQDCVGSASVIGFVFGDPGAGATGHGAYVKDGTARFTLKNFTIQ